jgi:hypothetical protein
MLLFLVIAALLVSVLVIIAVNPLLWLEHERRWTGIDRSRLITDRAKYTATTRLFAILAIIVFVAFVLGIINFDSVFEAQGTAERQLIRQELERDRELRENFRRRPGFVPPPLQPERPRP